MHRSEFHRSAGRVLTIGTHPYPVRGLLCTALSFVRGLTVRQYTKLTQDRRIPLGTVHCLRRYPQMLSFWYRTPQRLVITS